MGLDISKITNEALKALAFINDNNNDNKLTEEEFGIFKQEAAKKLEAGECTAEEFNEVMGLYVSEDAKSKKTPKEPKEKLTQEEKNDQIRVRKYVLRKLNEIINGSQHVTAEDLIPKLEEELGEDEKYAELTKAVKDVQELMPEYKSLKEMTVKAHNEVLAKMKEAGINDQFHRDILKLLEDQAEFGLRKQAVEWMQEYYFSKAEKYAEQGVQKSDEDLMKEIKNDIKNGKVEIDGKPVDFKDEYKDAFKVFEESTVAREARKTVLLAVYDQLDETKWRQVSKEAKALLKETGEWDDKYVRKAWKEKIGDPISGEERLSKTASKIQARENNVEQSKIQTKEEILKILGKKNEVFEALVLSGLITEKEDGTYDLTVLSDIIGIYTGADNKINRHAKIDKYISEKLRTTGKLSYAAKLEDLSEKEAMDLVKLCGYEIEGVNWGRALLGALAGGLVGAVSGGAAAATNPKQGINDYYISELNLDFKIEGGSVTNISGLEGVEGVDIINTGNSLRVIINHTDVFHALFEASKFVADTALKSAILPAIIGFISGLEAEGEAAVTPTTPEDCSIEEYVATVRKENPEYADVLSALAFMYYDGETGEWNQKEFKDLLNRAASPGGKLNKEELIGAMKKLYVQPEEPVVEETPASATVYNESTPDKTETEDLTYVHERKYGDTWAGLVTAYYPELVEKYGLYGKDGAIKRLQRELCTDENGVYNAELFKDLISRTNLPEKIKMPYEIDGVKRVIGDVVAATAEQLGTGNGQGGMKEIGRDEIRITQIPGTNVWKAVDNDPDQTSSPAYGSSAEEAIQNLQEATGKIYDNENITYES